MATRILICLAAVIIPALCDINFYDSFGPYCDNPYTLVTTTAAAAPSTTLGYPTLFPVERCCPQCEKCKHLGGTCHLKWALHLYKECICDFRPVAPCRDYSCECCITCQDDTCSDCTQTGGSCRKNCRAGEVEDLWNTCSYYNNGTDGCKCCKKCEATSECTDAWGKCVAHKDSCPWGTYPSTGCCGGCTCCKPVLEPAYGSKCAAIPGSYCSEYDDCAPGYYGCLGECVSLHFINGLEQPQSGYCCIPKNVAPVRAITRAEKTHPNIGNKIHHNTENKIQHNIGNKNHHEYDNLVAEQALKMQAQNRHPRQLNV